MRWSITVGQIAGTAVRIHATFILFLLFIGIVVYRTNGPDAALDTLVFITLIFTCVVLHEFGHIAMARYFGIRTRDVTLFPIGGIANIERMPEEPYKELLVALAGPLVNLIIFIGIVLALGNGFQTPDLEQINDMSAGLAIRLATANLILMIFNLLPAFPMDGGRVLRALLAMRIAKARATKYAAGIGQAIALLLGFLGFFGNPMLILIAFFIFIAAGAEADMVAFHDATSDLSVYDAMVTSLTPLKPSDTIRSAIDQLLRSTDENFPVFGDDNRYVGIVTREDLLSALASNTDGTPLSTIMRQVEHILYETDPLEKALSIFERSDIPALLVKDAADHISGLISRAAIAQAILIRAARPNWVFHRGGYLANSLPLVNRGRPVASL